MSAVFDPPVRSIGDLLRRLGDIHPDRVRLDPVPGTATADDLLDPENAGCELVDGTLVEKAVGWEEALLGGWLYTVINQYVLQHNLGAATPGDGFITLASGPVRGPDVCFTSWARMPNRRMARGIPFPLLSPDLVVEVLSPSNTPAETSRKRDEYFRGGTREVWEVDQRVGWLRRYTSPGAYTELTAADTLTGDPVLPGFTLKLADLFAELDRHG